MDITSEKKKEMYSTMLLARRMDERAWALHRQGKIAFHISGIGHEAAQVGAAYAIRAGYDWVVPYYRDLALMMALGFTAREYALGLYGRKEDPTSGGHQMPNHWSSRKMNIVSHSAPVATQSVHASGVGLAIKLSKEDKVVLTTIGEGSTSQGEWYEAVNWAAVQQLPVIFLVQNNLYAISEPPSMQMAVKSTAEKACGLGLPGIQVDGTDVFAVYDCVSLAVDNARRGNGPSVIEARMYRITPHSSDDDDRSYRTRDEVNEHKQFDPLLMARQKLEKEGILTPGIIEEMETRVAGIVDEAVAYAEAAPFPEAVDAQFAVYAQEVPNV
jgi:2-oxoisovalerate dehydrogenase E1 component alpha subunit